MNTAMSITDKNKPMLVKDIVVKAKEKFGACPRCGSIVYDCDRRCWHCYQAITFEEKKGKGCNE